MLLLFVFLEYSLIIMYEYASMIHNYLFIKLITMILVFYKLLEIYHNIYFLLYIELQNCSVNIKRVYSDILSYNTGRNTLDQLVLDESDWAESDWGKTHIQMQVCQIDGHFEVDSRKKKSESKDKSIDKDK